jgi:FkbM family methyltransferase
MMQKILRCLRVTKYLPYFRGITLLQRVYEFVLPKGDLLMSVNDLDGDLKMVVNLRDCMGLNIWHRPEFNEKHERKLFCDAIAPGSVVLDVGANIGLYTLLAAKRGARVFAIEADPRNLELLRQNVHLNGFDDRVTIFPIAAGNQQGMVMLYRTRGNSGNSNLFEGIDPVQVPCRTIDSLNLPPIDVCKMDIEGNEVSALRGMGATIARSPQIKMLIEYAERFGKTDGMMEFISARFEPVYAIRFPPFGPKGPLSTSMKPPAFCNLWAMRNQQSARITATVSGHSS